MPYDHRCSTIFQNHLNLDVLNFLGRWLDGAYLRNHSPKCWICSFSQSQNSTSRRPFPMKLSQVAVLSSSRTWKNFTVRSLLDGEIWLCENGPKNSASVCPDVVLWSYFATSNLHVKTTFAMNWWHIISYKVSPTSAEHICFRWKYFFLGLFGRSTWLHRA